MADPAATVVTTPPDEIVATAELLLDQVPPEVVSEKVDVIPLKHNEDAPVIAPGARTVIVVVTGVQPVVVYDMVTAPGLTPYTIPADASIVAIDVLLVLQTPPEVASVIVVVPPTQTVTPLDGAIAAGGTPTVTPCTTAQPLDV